MRKYEIGKVVDGLLITPTENEYKKIVLTNPTKEQMKYLLGYFDIDTEEVIAEPEYDEATQVLFLRYYLDEETQMIKKNYDVVEISDIENIEIPEDAII